MGGHGSLGRGPLVRFTGRGRGVPGRLVRGYLQAGAHLTWAASAYRTDGVTAPISTCPFVMSMETRAVCSSLPLPQAPCTGWAARTTAPSTAEPLIAPPPPDTDLAA